MSMTLPTQSNFGATSIVYRNLNLVKYNACYYSGSEFPISTRKSIIKLVHQGDIWIAEVRQG